MKIRTREPKGLNLQTKEGIQNKTLVKKSNLTHVLLLNKSQKSSPLSTGVFVLIAFFSCDFH